jgi:hypothetical protein
MGVPSAGPDRVARRPRRIKTLASVFTLASNDSRLATGVIDELGRILNGPITALN